MHLQARIYEDHKQKLKHELDTQKLKEEMHEVSFKPRICPTSKS